MAKQHGPWQILGSRQVYRDPWIEVDRDEVIRPDGAPGTHCVVRLKAGVSVLAIDAEDYIYLTDEFHYGVGRQCLEVVSGGIEPGEETLGTAQRELEEELGIAAARWTPLGVLDPFTTVVVSPTALFLAEDLRFVADAPEGTERIRRVRVSLAEAVEMVFNDSITHAPSCVLILKTHLLRGCRAT
jgi:ADP-ribose pyrophosphatase